MLSEASVGDPAPAQEDCSLLCRIHQGPAGEIDVEISANPALCDAFSLRALLTEAIQRCMQDSESAAGVDDITYLDYAASHWAMIASGELADEERFWLQESDRGPARTPLLFVSKNQGDTLTSAQSLELEPGVRDALSRLAEKLDVSGEVVVHTAVRILLARLSGQPVACLGIPLDARELMGLGRAVGLYTQIVPHRYRYDGERTFLAAVQETRSAREAYQENNCVPCLEPGEGLSATFRAWSAHWQDLGPGCRFKVVDEVERLDCAPLSFEFVEADESATLRLRYDQSACRREDADVLLRRLLQLLRAGVLDVDAAVGDLPLALDGELDGLVGGKPLPADLPITTPVAGFVAQARRTPLAPALEFRGRTTTYAELLESVQLMAGRLARLGVQRGDRVGICLAPCEQSLVAMLASMWLGAAFVPLDPDEAPGRMKLIASDAMLTIVLCSKETQELLRGLHPRPIQLRDLDELPAAPVAEPLTRADDTAYLMYTSGSSGQPKGVEILQSSLASYLAWVNAAFWVDGAAWMPAVSRLTFDAVLKQTVGVLLRGGTVWLQPREVITQPRLLIQELLSRRGVLLNCVVSVWSALLDELDELPTDERARLGECLSGLLIGGERVTGRLLQRTAAALPDLRVWVLYGPTETTATACFGEWSGEAEPLLGRPAPGVRAYVLDARGIPVPRSTPGELCIAGAQVARGYWRRPEETSRHFISGLADERGLVYRSGDLVSWTEDGRLRFHGRVDQQVKVRGQRVELAEVEACVGSIPSVVETATVAISTKHGLSLHAFVVTSNGMSPTELRRAVGERLPDYMVPTRFTRLSELPLTHSGKVDRQELMRRASEAPEQRRLRPEEEPRGESEALVAALWREALETEPVGRHDDFFALGGHSLLIARVVNQLRQRGAEGLSLKAAVRTPTLEQVARLYEEARGGIAPQTPTPGAPRHLVALNFHPASSVPSLVCLHGGDGSLSAYHALVGRLEDYDVTGFETSDTHQTTIQAIASEYVAELSSHHAAARLVLIGWSFGGAVAFEMARLLGAAGAVVDSLVLIDAATPALMAGQRGYATDDIAILQSMPGQLNGEQVERLRALSSLDARVEEFVRMVPELRGLDVPAIKRYVEVYRRHLHAVNLYPSAPDPVDPPGLLLRAREERCWEGHAEDLGWAPLLADLRVQWLAGDHRSVMNDGESLAQAIRLWIERDALGGRPPR